MIATAGGQAVSGNDKAFTGSIPKIYETYLVPLIFEDYAADLARRVNARSPKDVLEIAAGTGVVTRAMAAVLRPMSRTTRVKHGRARYSSRSKAKLPTAIALWMT